jgi:hypothetical protein
MRRRLQLLALLALSGAALLAGCAQAPKQLYMWESFPRQQYDALLREGMSPASQIQAMEEHAAKARGANAALPPGFRAHLGMLYLGAGNADKAREMWVTEKATFPESTPYMNQLLRRLDGDAPKSTAKTKGSPA